ncbi:hypothetical protein DACRYDRAFT_20706 [Dacryopinax primogenitus]|uniref:PWWP domain-containing protein n=1 Tax=Dacryopinax primogenitus (strain DJM 731) TaxID=1858805 RepID=M5GFC0_DACPD|nr:uncharacterized protein DACRYDRAFT_20706 [Dacryopinax primogenitus]EJU04028.1 hypothetical protein DACRYDRAFT_20706 [Dacryopinax primogenitus]
MDNYEDLQPSRHLRSHAHLLGPDRYEVGELVLGKLQGHPPWPGKIADPHKLPMQIALACPDRDDPDVYPIRFYPDGDYWWVRHTEIVRLDQERVAKFVRETRANFGPLLEGYKIARDTTEWEANNPTPEDVVDLYRIEMPEKPKPKEPISKPVHGKRKRGPHREDSNEPQPHRKRRRGERYPDGEFMAKRRRKIHSFSAAEETPTDNVKYENESAEPDIPPPMSPRTAAAEAAQERKNKLLKTRWLLQKTFLSTDRPNELKYPDASRVLEELRNNTEITGALLRETKLQKVLMGITKMDYIRSDDEFKFRSRAKEILKSWEHIPLPDITGAGPGTGVGHGINGAGNSVNGDHVESGARPDPLVVNTRVVNEGGDGEPDTERMTSVPRGTSDGLTPMGIFSLLPGTSMSPKEAREPGKI